MAGGGLLRRVVGGIRRMVSDNLDAYPIRSPYHHRAADRWSSELANWNPALRSADSEWLGERNIVAARLHDIARNNGWVSGLLQRYVDQVIGSDFRLSYRPDYVALGLDAEWAHDFQAQVEAAFRQWANDTRCVCDASEQATFSGLLGLAFRHRLIDGEALALPQWLPGRPGVKYATAVQLIDPDRLSTPAGMVDNDTMRGGVEINVFGAAQAYHIRKVHPGEVYTTSPEMMVWERVPRRTPWGRSRVIHFFEKERAAQTRGKSILTPIVERLKMEDRYSRIELQAALVNAIFAAFIESPFDTTLVEDGIDAAGVATYQQQRKAFHDDRRITLDGAQIPHLFPGEKFTMPSAAHPNSNFENFERTVLRYFAAATGQSYEQIAQDWSQTNYSSARAAMLETWKFMSARRGHFANGVATPIFALWFEEAVDRGDVVLPDGAPDFWEAFGAWTRCRWIGPGRGWVDPVKEAQAAVIRVQGGLSTMQDECAEQGKDYEEVMEQQAREGAMRERLQLPEPSATPPAPPTGAGVPASDGGYPSDTEQNGPAPEDRRPGEQG